MGKISQSTPIQCSVEQDHSNHLSFPWEDQRVQLFPRSAGFCCFQPFWSSSGKYSTLQKAAVHLRPVDSLSGSVFHWPAERSFIMADLRLLHPDFHRSRYNTDFADCQNQINRWIRSNACAAPLVPAAFRANHSDRMLHDSSGVPLSFWG